MKEVKAYQCEYCGELSESVANMVKHQKACRHNPSNRWCESCKHHVENKETYDEINAFCLQYDCDICDTPQPFDYDDLFFYSDGDCSIRNCPHWEKKSND